jgi:hypothetical protein
MWRARLYLQWSTPIAEYTSNTSTTYQGTRRTAIIQAPCHSSPDRFCRVFAATEAHSRNFGGHRYLYLYLSDRIRYESGNKKRLSDRGRSLAHSSDDYGPSDVSELNIRVSLDRLVKGGYLVGGCHRFEQKALTAKGTVSRHNHARDRRYRGLGRAMAPRGLKIDFCGRMAGAAACNGLRDGGHKINIEHLIGVPNPEARRLKCRHSVSSSSTGCRSIAGMESSFW